jgi:hypothetical protein
MATTFVSEQAIDQPASSHIHPIRLRAASRDDAVAILIRHVQEGRVVARHRKTGTGTPS